MEKTDIKVVHSIPKYEEKEHIHSTKCSCSPLIFIGKHGEVIIRHRNFFLEFSFKKEFEDIGIN